MVTGTGGVFGLPDTGSPPTGVITEGVLNKAGWTYVDIDLAGISLVRSEGVVLERLHWQEQAGRDKAAPFVKLRQFSP